MANIEVYCYNYEADIEALVQVSVEITMQDLPFYCVQRLTIYYYLLKISFYTRYI